MVLIPAKFIDAIKVQFIQPIFEDDFPEVGMTAWLTAVEKDKKSGLYKLYFDFTEFEDINEKYFRQVYHSNRHTDAIKEETGRVWFTARETRNYDPKYSVYFSLSNDTLDDALFEVEILNYLRLA